MFGTGMHLVTLLFLAACIAKSSSANVTCYDCDQEDDNCETPGPNTPTCSGLSCFKIKSKLGTAAEYMRGCNRWNFQPVCGASYGKDSYDPTPSSTGFTCYCNDKDLCNHAAHQTTISFVLLLILTAFARWQFH